MIKLSKISKYSVNLSNFSGGINNYTLGFKLLYFLILFLAEDYIILVSSFSEFSESTSFFKYMYYY